MIDERVLHHLAGAGHLDARLALWPGRWRRPSGCRTPWPAVRTVPRPGPGRTVLLHGPQPDNVHAVAAAAADRRLCTRSRQARDLPADPRPRPDAAPDGAGDSARRARLGGGAVGFGARPEEVAGLGRSLLGFDGPLAVLAGAGAGPSPETGPSDAVDVPVERLTLAERRQTLRMTLRQNGCRPAAETDLAAGVFDLSLDDAGLVAREVSAGERLWASCRRRTRAGLGDLAAVVVPRAGGTTWCCPVPSSPSYGR